MEKKIFVSDTSDEELTSKLYKKTHSTQHPKPKQLNLKNG